MFTENKNKDTMTLVSILIYFQGSLTSPKNMPLLNF